MEQKQAEEYMNILEKIDKDINNKKGYWVGQGFQKIVNELDFRSGEDMNNELCKYFKHTFDNLFSNSILLWKDNKNMSWNQESITGGRYGFGIRQNKQARPIEDMVGITTLGKHLNEVMASLNARRKWNKADELEKYYKILEGVNFEKYSKIEIPLKKPVKVTQTYTSNRMKVMETKLLRLHFSGNRRFQMSLGDSKEKDNDYINVIPIEKEYGISEIGMILCNFIINDQLEELLTIFKQELAKLVSEQKKILEEMDKEFGKFIMANNL